MAKISYLSGSFMLLSLIGLVFSATWLYSFSKPYGFALSIVFASMLGASIVSMTHAPLPDDKYRNI